MPSDVPQSPDLASAQSHPQAAPVRVFISYTHDSAAHQQEMLSLSDRLRRDGVDCTIDLYEDSPVEGWPAWMLRQIETSDFVLAVCTEAYYRRVMGQERPGVGLGARWEGRHILQSMYDAGGDNARFIPIVPSSGDVAHIPLPLRGATYYRPNQTGEYDRLLRRMTAQPAVVKPPVGKVPALPPQPRHAQRAIPWNVPFRRNPFFTGRDDVIESIATSRNTAGVSVITQAISGLGGIGKTQTAVEYAYRYRDRYNAVFWVRAETRAELQAGLVEIARLLNLPEQGAEVADDVIRAVLAWLGSHDGWLLVFDNADTPTLLTGYLPDNPRGHVLLTSRASTLDPLGVAEPIVLRPLSSEDAVRFLFARTGRQPTDADTAVAARIAEALGWLPLALEQAGAFLTETRSPLAAYEVSYRANRLALLERSTPATGDYAASVATTWAMNFSELERASPTAAALLRISAFLAPDAIPLELLVLGAAELGPEVSAALTNVGDDPVVLYQTLQPLTRYSLIELDPDANVYSVHRLVQEHLRASMTEDDQRKWAQRAVRALNQAFPEASFPNWPLCDQLIPHVKLAAGWVAKWGFSIDDAGNLLNEGASFLRMRADYTAAEAMHKQSVALAEAAWPPDDERISGRLNNLAFVYLDQLRFEEAERLFARALQIAEATHVPDDSDLVLPLNNLGMLYVRMGRFEMAAPLIDRALALWRETDDQAFFTALLLNNKAEVLIGLGRYDEALEFAERALNMRERIGNLEKTARSYNTLAFLYFKLRRYADADAMFVKAIEAKEQVHGVQHTELIGTLERYAEFLSAEDRESEAANARMRSEAIQRKVRHAD
jgi:tetratricopeptide (TPR) repeat protein